MSRTVRMGRIGSPRLGSIWDLSAVRARSGENSSPARTTASTRWPRRASMRTARRACGARATRISGSRIWTAMESTPRSSSASSASPHGSATRKRPMKCCASTTTGSRITAATILTARLALPVCPTAISKPRAREMASGQTRRAAQFTGVAGFQMNLINIIAAIIGAGVLERYPNLRIGLGESGIVWLPYALDRMDFEYEDRFRDLMKLKPSEYWRRQCRATFQFDRIGAKLVEDIGVETLMWGSDYPHPDGVWPESSKYIDEQFAGLSPDVVHKITCENAGKFYGLIN